MLPLLVLLAPLCLQSGSKRRSLPRLAPYFRGVKGLEKNRTSAHHTQLRERDSTTWRLKVTENEKYCLNQTTPSTPAAFPRGGDHKFEQTSINLERLMGFLRQSGRELNSMSQRGKKFFLLSLTTSHL